MFIIDATFGATYFLIRSWLRHTEESWDYITERFFDLAVKYVVRAWLVFLPYMILDIIHAVLLLLYYSIEVICWPLEWLKEVMAEWCDWKDEARELDKNLAKDFEELYKSAAFEEGEF